MHCRKAMRPNIAVIIIIIIITIIIRDEALLARHLAKMQLHGVLQTTTDDDRRQRA